MIEFLFFTIILTILMGVGFMLYALFHFLPGIVEEKSQQAAKAAADSRKFAANKTEYDQISRRIRWKMDDLNERNRKGMRIPIDLVTELTSLAQQAVSLLPESNPEYKAMLDFKLQMESIYDRFTQKSASPGPGPKP